MNHSTPGLPVHHQLPEFTETHFHRVSDAIQPSLLCCPLLLLPPIPPSIRVFSNVSTLQLTFIQDTLCMLSRFSHVRPLATLSLPISSVQGILQAKILEWVAMPFCRGSSWPRVECRSLTSPALAGRFFTASAAWEANQDTLVAQYLYTNKLLPFYWFNV